MAALCRGGFHIVALREDATVLDDGYRAVLVPARELLARDVLLGLLRDAQIPYSRFLELMSDDNDVCESGPRLRVDGVQPRRRTRIAG